MPTTLIGLLLFVILLAPGFAYTLQRERASAQRTISTFRETARLALASILANTAVLCAFALLRALAPEATPDIGALIRSPNRYTTTHYRQLSAWGTSLLTAAVLLATTAGSDRAHRLAICLTTTRQRTTRPDHAAYLSAWWLMFAEHPNAQIHVGCFLEDGSYVAGRLWSFSRSADDHPDRELTLIGPITYRPAHTTEPHELSNVGAASISARRITLLTVTYLDTNDTGTSP